ncbi:MAG TPA: DMT family transporter [Candidatus Polarisedimenticolaceae bacterium]
MKAMALAIAAGCCWGIGEACTKSVLHTGKIGPLTAIAVRSAIALPVLGLAWWIATHGIAFEPRGALKALGAADLLKLVIGSGLVAGAGGMICFYGALSLGDLSQVKPVAFTVAPALATLLGWLVLGEGMSWRKGIAVLLILAGVVLLTGGGVARPR